MSKKCDHFKKKFDLFSLKFGVFSHREENKKVVSSYSMKNNHDWATFLPAIQVKKTGHSEGHPPVSNPEKPQGNKGTSLML